MRCAHVSRGTGGVDDGWPADAVKPEPIGCHWFSVGGEACATPASFVWRFQAALNAFWDLGRGADDKSGGFLVDE